MTEKRVLGKYMAISQVAAFVIFLIVSFIFTTQAAGQKTSTDINDLTTGWSSTVGSGAPQTLDTLPSSIDSGNTGTVTLSRTIDKDIDSNDYIGFFTAFQTVQVEVNGKVIYELKAPGGPLGHTPGKVWNFVNMDSSFANQPINISITNSYGTGAVGIPQFLYGSQSDIETQFFQSQIFAIVTSLFMLFVGLVGFGYWIYSAKKKTVQEVVPYLVVTIFFTAIWSLMETQIMSLLFGTPLFFNQVAFLSLKIYSFTQLQFLMIILAMKQDKFFKGLLWATFASFWISVIMQVTGKMDFMTTSYLSTVIGFISIVYGTVILIRLMVKNNKKDGSYQKVLRAYLAMLGIMIAFGIFNSIYSYMPNVIDSARYNRIGTMIFLGGMVFMVLNNSVKLMEEGKAAQSIKMKAETDSMTQLKNRSAFDSAMAELMTKSKDELADMGIVMCDLNNLKMANDEYGHELGDRYITSSAGIIRDNYGKFGTPYRIGGDEFCVIVSGLTEEAADGLRVTIGQQAEQMSTAGAFAKHSFSMGIASGYAKFDSALDQNISETQKRADAIMYENKSHMKHRGHNRAEDFIEETEHVEPTTHEVTPIDDCKK